ncbi:MAG TPA: CHASE3 domain-containing protein [Gemmatimonadaceae bacterium]|nr:CHASE3 domain-containing protein [Gemmatimonadaceae bacterium]
MTSEKPATPRHLRITARLAEWSRAQHLTAVLAPCIVVLVFAALLYAGQGAQVAGRAEVAHTHMVIERVERVLARLTDAETGQRGYLLTGRADYLQPHLASERDATMALDSLRALVAGKPSQIARLDTLAAFATRKFAELDTTITLARTGRRDSAVSLVKTDVGKRYMDGARRIASEMEQSETTRLAAHSARQARLSAIIELVIVLGTVVAVLVALLSNTLLSRHAAAHERLSSELDASNARLEEQALELEIQNQQLQEQAVEMEQQQQHLQEQATELETQSEELTNANEELLTVNSELERAVLDVGQQWEVAQAARRAAETASAAKSEFLATMSHELRTPLNAISGYVDLLSMELRGPVTDAQREDLARIKKSGQHLLSLINDILNLARIESGRLDIQLGDVRLADVLANVETLMAPQMRAKGLTYNESRGSESLSVHADAEKLQQILLNLLTNACKFTPSGGSVQVLCEDAPFPHGNGNTNGQRVVAVRVADTGRGIPQEKLASVFEPFVQIDRQATHGSQQGVGLGLAISRHLARAMGGDLRATSVVGEGSTFTLTLPVAGKRALGRAEGSAPLGERGSGGDAALGEEGHQLSAG